MAENRRKYTDNYNPVVDLPSKTGQSVSSEGRDGNVTSSRSVPKKSGSGGRRVRTGVKKDNSKPKSGENNGSSGARAESHTGLSFHSLKANLTGQTARWLYGIFIGGLAVYLLVAFVSYFAHCIEDQATIINSGVGALPKVNNKAGEAGARLAEFLINGSFGLGSFVIIFWLGVIALKLLSGWPKFKTVNFTIKCIVALITVSLIIGLLTLASDTPVNWGGYHGRYVNQFIIGFFGWIGAVILCILFVAIFFIICLRDIVNWAIRKKNEIMERRREAIRIRKEQEELEQELMEMRRREELDAIRAGESAGEENTDEIDDSTLKFSGEDAEIDPSLQGYDLDDEPDTEPHPDPTRFASGQQRSGEHSTEDESQPGQESVARAESVNQADEASENPANAESGNMTSDDSKTPIGKQDAVDENSSEESSEETTDSNSDRMVVNVNHIAKAESNSSSGSLKHLYKFPSPTLLREGETHVSVDEEEQAKNQERIRETLLYHKIPITKIEATVGPTVTLYEIRPEQGVKIAKIKNLADDIALSLAARGVRVIAPIPGKGTVGIEVANAEPRTVSMRTIIESRKYAESRYRLPVALGSTIGNNVYIADLTKMPHLLVAGATGQGKSVGLNAIIASLLYKKRPDELKFVMIDPKEVEFSLYAKIESHYLAKLEDSEAIVTDMSKVVTTLQSLCQEMDNRYKLLRTAEVRNIEEYNAKIERSQLSPADGHRFLPYIVLVVDEFADLIMTSGKEVETPIARLAQKARAIGIHVIIATQRPSTNVITGIIKANFPVRIAFKVSSGVDSKTILDTIGAQQLIGKGDMLISNNSEMVRVQCAFIETPEVEKICEYIHNQPFNSGPYLLPDPLTADGGDYGGSVGGPESLDPLFSEVAEIVVTSGVGSTSGIQRRLSIGYNRAGKIMDQMEHFGIVGPSMGGKPRQVLMSSSELQDFLSRLNH